MSPSPPALFDPRRLTDETLLALRTLVVDKIDPAAPALGKWLYQWADVEQYWRSRDPQRRPARHCLALPNVAGWTDADFGDAIYICVCLNYVPMPESLGTFFDRIRLGLAELLRDRLRGAHAPRDASD